MLLLKLIFIINLDSSFGSRGGASRTWGPLVHSSTPVLLPHHLPNCPGKGAAGEPRAQQRVKEQPCIGMGPLSLRRLWAGDCDKGYQRGSLKASGLQCGGSQPALGLLCCFVYSVRVCLCRSVSGVASCRC